MTRWDRPEDVTSDDDELEEPEGAGDDLPAGIIDEVSADEQDPNAFTMVFISERGPCISCEGSGVWKTFNGETYECQVCHGRGFVTRTAWRPALRSEVDALKAEVALKGHVTVVNLRTPPWTGMPPTTDKNSST